jgi:endothelin-converting enzyme/putative endopeptidase
MTIRHWTSLWRLFDRTRTATVGRLAAGGLAGVCLLPLVSLPSPAAAEEPAKALPADQESLGSGIEKQYFSDEVSAGSDFYQYVNDGWLQATDIPADKSDYGTFTVLNDRTQQQVRQLIEAAADQQAAAGTDTQKVGDFYRSYVDLEARNAAGVAPLTPILEQVDSVTDNQQLAAAMGQLRRDGVVGPFVTYISPDARRSDQYAVYASQSGITLPDRDYYLKDEPRYVELREKLQTYIAEMLAAVDIENAEDKAGAIFELETKIAEAMWTNVENRDPVNTYNKKTSQEIQSLLSAFSWDAYASAAGIDQQDEFIIRQPSYFESLNTLFAEVPLETWKAYLTYRIVDAYAPATTEELEQRHFEFNGTAITGVEQQKPLWKRGVETTESSLGEILGKLYVEQNFAPEAKARMEQLVDNLKRAFAARITQLDWMGPGTKKQAMEKLSKFTTKIGYPDKWKDYSMLEIAPDDLVGNLVRSANVEYQRDLDKLGGPIDRTEWFMTPQTINAYYNPVMNEIVFPAAILQPPFFDMQADDAVNYGAIGAVIGHEISHGFDDKGSQYDGTGNLRDWWTIEDRTEFEQRADNLVQQYGQYKPFDDMNVNGELTLGENIGDLGGLSVAYEAYQLSLDGEPAPVIDGLTGPQRFFLGWSQIWRRKYREPELRRRLLTDPHSPSRYRVNGIVSNLDAFYEAFEIKPGDPMYIAPEDRVRIW